MAYVSGVQAAQLLTLYKKTANLCIVSTGILPSVRGLHALSPSLVVNVPLV